MASAGMAVLVASACTHVVQVERPVPVDVQQTIQNRSVGSDATVLTTGGPFTTRALRFEGESLAARGQAGEAHAFEVGDVRSVRFRSGGEGALEGIVWGVGTAAALGLLTALTTEPEDTLFFDSRAGVALFGVVVWTLVTVPVGGIIGLIKGKTTDYVFDGSGSR